MTDTVTLTLTDFLLARIAEDEAAAREAASLAEAPWRATYGRQVETARDGYLVTPEDEHSDPDDPADAVSQHIARHDPARVLADCEAKRRIVELHGSEDGKTCDLCSNYDRTGLNSYDEPAPCPTVRALAAVYADHSDYRDEWRA